MSVKHHQRNTCTLRLAYNRQQDGQQSSGMVLFPAKVWLMDAWDTSDHRSGYADTVYGSFLIIHCLSHPVTVHSTLLGCG
jgi:hypothetical protein